VEFTISFFAGVVGQYDLSRRMMQPRVVIILINYNNEYHTIECIRSLNEVSYDNFRIVVVDNGSQRSSLEAVMNNCRDVELISAGANLGFAGGNNVGIRKALMMNADYVLLLNNDTLVDARFLDPLVNAMERNSTLGAVSGTICNHPDVDTIWYAGGTFVPWRAIGMHLHMNEPYPKVLTLTPAFVTFISGCLMLIRSSVLRSIGFFDEKLFMYFEDLEFSVRLLKNGYRLGYVPASRIYHKILHKGDTPFTVYYGIRSRLVLINSCLGGMIKVIAFSATVLTLTVRLIQWRLRSPNLYRAALMAIRDYRKDEYGAGAGATLRYPE
jgi:GT2 family glycosyltransferase